MGLCTSFIEAKSLSVDDYFSAVHTETFREASAGPSISSGLGGDRAPTAGDTAGQLFSVKRSGTFPVINHGPYSGLKSDHFRSLCKTSDGVIWAGSDIDIVKYEGGQFTSIDSIYDTPITHVWDIYESSDRTVWVSMYSQGVIRYTPDSTYVYYKSRVPDPRIRKFIEFQGDMYALSDSHLLRFNFETDRWDILPMTDCDKSNPIFTSGFEHKNQLYLFCFACGFYTLDKDTVRHLKGTRGSTFAYYLHGDSIAYTLSQKLVHETIEKVIENPFRAEGPLHSHIWNWTETPLGAIGAGWGVAEITGGLKLLQGRELVDISAKMGVYSRDVYDLLYDSTSQILWVATLDEGLFWVDLSQTQRNYKINTAIGEIFDLARWNDRHYVACDSGLFHSANLQDFEGLGNESLYRLKTRLFKRTEAIGIDQWLREEPPIGLRAMGDYLMVGFPFETWAWTPEGPTHLHPFGSSVYAKNGRGVYAGSPYQGVYYVDEQQNITPLLDKKKYLIDMIPLWDSVVVQGKSTWMFWLSQNRGTPFKPSPAQSENFNFIQAIDDDLLIRVSDRNNFYALKMEMAADTVRATESLWRLGDALNGSDLIGFHTLKKGVLIAITEKGLHWMTDSTIQFRPFFEDLTEKRIRKTKLLGDTLYLIGKKHLYEIDVHRFFERWNAPWELQVRDLSINEQLYPRYPTERLTLHSLEELKGRVISTIDQWNQLSNYQLVIENDERIFSSTQLNDSKFHIRYLPPGNYRIFVEARNPMQTGHIRQMVAQIEVLGPIWVRSWFVAIAVLAIVLIAIRLTSYEIKRRQQKEARRIDLERRIADSRIEALQSQMSPHFIFNALNSIQSLILNEQTDASLHYLNQFAQLTRYALENSTVKWISLEEELKFLNMYMNLENLRFEHAVDIQVTMDPELELADTYLPPLLLQPIIENAFKHAFPTSHRAKIIEIKFERRNGWMEISIADNGIGMQASKRAGRNSKGLQLVQERMNLLYPNRDTLLTTVEDVSQGTFIKIRVPIDFARENA